METRLFQPGAGRKPAAAPASPLSHTLARLRGDLSRGRWAEGPLPSVRALSRELGASSVTVFRALRKLREEGLLVAHPQRRGFHRADAPAPGGGEAGPVPVRRVAEALKGRILLGAYGVASPLPQMKALRAEFRVGHATLGRALRSLAAEGLLEIRGRRLYPRLSAAPPAPAARVFLTGHPASFRASHLHYPVFLKGLETALARAGWSAPGEFLVREWGGAASGAGAPPDHTVAGFIHLCQSHGMEWFRFFGRRPHLPAAILDLQEQSPWPATLLLHKRMLLITSDNRTAGREMALHLASRGHARIAYFDPDFGVDQGCPSLGWQRARLAGLADIFPEAAGNPDGRGLRRFRPDPALPMAPFPELGHAVQAMLGRFREGARIPEPALDQVRRAIYGLVDDFATACAWERSFAAALGEGAGTAWVCANDRIAAAALAFLGRRGIPVPGPIAVAGFDNTALGRELGLTSYDFALEELGAMAVRWLVDPAQVGRSRDGALKIPGKLVPRASTAGTRA